MSTTMSSSSSSSSTASKNRLKFVDIGANLLDERYIKGEYFGKVKHVPDLDCVIQRSIESGVSHIIITAGTLLESYQAIQLVKNLRSNGQHSDIKFGCTVGIHPTRCSQEFVNIATSNTVVVASKEEDEVGESPPATSLLSLPSPPPIPSTADDVLHALLRLVADDSSQEDDCSVVAIGEIGLDYDRLQFCAKEIQLEYLQKQLDIFDSDPVLHKLPFFLHNRNCGTDLLDILKNRERKDYTGVVHSYDDTIELAHSFIDLGFYIGINGCSLKTDENLQVVKEIPLSSILLETDCPYCEIKSTHSSMKYLTDLTKFDKTLKKHDKKFELGKMVKGRNEPNHIIQVAEVIANVKGIPLEQVATTCYENSMKLYTKFKFTT